MFIVYFITGCIYKAYSLGTLLYKNTYTDHKKV